MNSPPFSNQIALMLCSNYISIKDLNSFKFIKHSSLTFNMYTHTFLKKLSKGVTKYLVSLMDIVLMGPHIPMHNLQRLSYLQLVHMKDIFDANPFWFRLPPIPRQQWIPFKKFLWRYHHPNEHWLEQLPHMYQMPLSKIRGVKSCYK